MIYTIIIFDQDGNEVQKKVDETFFTLNKEEIGGYIQELATGLIEQEIPF